MKPINVKSFLWYAVMGTVFAILASVAQSCADRDDRLSPAYKAYRSKHEAYEKAKSAAEEGVVQRHFEESLAGAYPIEKLPNADLQEVARAIISWAKDSYVTSKLAGDQDRYDSAKSIAGQIDSNSRGPMLKHRTWQVKRLYYCDGYGEACRFEPEVSVLGDPSRLVLLLNGDKAGVLSSLPTEAADPGPEPTYPKDAPRTIDLPWIHGLRVWIVCSIFFTLGFVLLGWIFSVQGMGEDAKGKTVYGSDPLGLPDFAIGWLVMAAFAPGFLLTHALKAGFRDARPWVGRQRARLFPREFDDEFGELTMRLETMRAREQADGNAVVLGDIDALIEKVRLSKSRRHVAELRKALDAADGYLNGLEEIDRDLDGRPSA